MKPPKWQQLRLPADPDSIWEIFHENSKTSRYEIPPQDEQVAATMAVLWQSLPFADCPVIELPEEPPALSMSLDRAILSRTTARNIGPVQISLNEIAGLFRYAYGITRDNLDTGFPRPFRTVPSGGALYPLELFFYTTDVTELEAGLYHYNPAENVVRLVRKGDLSEQIADALVQRELAAACSVIVFITAVFQRSTFKYGDRGYRFALLEAGHVAQNINLVAVGLGLGAINLGGFFDRQIDALLELDGILHSTIYMVGIGENAEISEETDAVQDG